MGFDFPSFSFLGKVHLANVCNILFAIICNVIALRTHLYTADQDGATLKLSLVSLSIGNSTTGMDVSNIRFEPCEMKSILYLIYCSLMLDWIFLLFCVFAIVFRFHYLVKAEGGASQVNQISTEGSVSDKAVGRSKWAFSAETLSPREQTMMRWCAIGAFVATFIAFALAWVAFIPAALIPSKLSGEWRHWEVSINGFALTLDLAGVKMKGGAGLAFIIISAILLLALFLAEAVLTFWVLADVTFARSQSSVGDRMPLGAPLMAESSECQSKNGNVHVVL